MKVLLVNNLSKNIEYLHKMLSCYDVTEIKYSDIPFVLLKDFDLIVLSGGSTKSVMGHEDHWKYELEMIKNTDIPIIGICLGFQLITYAFGEKIYRQDEKIKGVLPISTLKNVFSEKHPKVYESHYWVVKKAPLNFTVLAKSEFGIEAFKHNTKPIWGFQFHPEKNDVSHDGEHMLFKAIKEIIQ